MAENSLRRLRRAAGYSSAKAFAEYVGIPAPTYAKYEQIEDGPETSMPIKNAWAIADALGCSIDELVGRKRIVPDVARGGIQDFYDGLSEAGKAKLEDYLGYLAFLEEQQSRVRAERHEIEVAMIERRLEEQYLASLDDDSIFSYRSPHRLRAGFEEFVANKAAKKRNEDAAEVMYQCGVEVREPLGLIVRDDDGCEMFLEADDVEEEIFVGKRVRELFDTKMKELYELDERMVSEVMAAYDKAHPEHAPKDGSVTYAFVSLE